jgi:spore coat polysaccharide biosynthesis protein SpsF
MVGGRTVALIQARIGSTRLPGKVLLPLRGVPLLARVLERASRIDGVDGIALAVPEGPAQDPIVDVAGRFPNVIVTRGPEDDVLRRSAQAVRDAGAATVVRITSDCPMIDPGVSGAVLAAYRQSGAAYARTAIHHGFPHGFDTEVVAAEHLLAADREATDPYEREHVTPFIWRRPERFSAVYLDHVPDCRHWRLVVDTAEDYAVARTIYERLHPSAPHFGFAELRRLAATEPEIFRPNSHIRQAAYPGAPAHA